MLPGMRRRLARLSLFAACLPAALPAAAIEVRAVQVDGVREEAIAQNILSALSLVEAQGKPLTARRLRYLLGQAEDETRRAVEPFGYYSPTVRITRSDGGRVPGAAGAAADAEADAESDSDDTAANADQARITVRIEVSLGPPVRVRRESVRVDGPGGEDAGVQAALAQFAPRIGQVLDQPAYEASKKRIGEALLRHGYFDADAVVHRIEVTRAAQAADIDLRWTSGERYRLGEARFVQTPTAAIRDRVLRKLVNWTPGQPYDAARLERLRRSLAGLDYFGLIGVTPQPEQAQGRQVPVLVELTPAPRSIYTVGASYGTLSGPGVNLGLERRYLNSLGHKALARLDYAKERKVLSLQYRVPAFAWLDGWYTAGLQAVEERTDSLDDRRLELVASRSGQYSAHLNLLASLHVLRERWSYLTLTLPTPTWRYASFTYPSLRADYLDVDDRLWPRRGLAGFAIVRGGRGGTDSNLNFAQLHARLQWFHPLGADGRLRLRGELGHTFTGAGEVLDLPPSLRFFAGGDGSIRGYGWREVGPRIRNSVGQPYPLGAANLVTASVEYERYFAGPWGAAVFVDTGSAFDSRPELRTGIGIGLRWRSPVGPVRVDIAHGLNRPDAPVSLTLNIGPDL